MSAKRKRAGPLDMVAALASTEEFPLLFSVYGGDARGERIMLTSNIHFIWHDDDQVELEIRLPEQYLVRGEDGTVFLRASVGTTQQALVRLQDTLASLGEYEIRKVV